jgi:hypothetical protein
MPIIKARSSSIIDSVNLRGTPTVATASAGTATTQVASTAFVSTGISNLINSAPSVLDTLAELSTALGDDANFATTITTAIGLKVAKAGDTMTGFLTLHADPVSELQAATKQYVDQEINSQMIYSSDDVPEGTTNLYYHTSSVRSDISLDSDNTSVLDYNSTTGQFTYNHPTSDGVLEGQTNKYYHTSAVRGDISLTSDDSTILSYSSVTGAFTFTTPSTDKIDEGASNQYFTTARARASVSAGTNMSYDSATGVISTQAAVFSVNTKVGDVVLNTDDVNEGSTNKYFSNAQARSAISLVSDDQTALSYVSGTGVFTYNAPDTDQVAEGAANVYFTQTRARDSVSADGDLSYNSATGVFSYNTPTTDGITEGTTNLYFLNSRARTAVSASKVSGDGAFSYDNTTGLFSYTGPSATDYRQAVSAIKASGHGNFEYNSTTGVFTYTGPTNTNYRAAISATKVSGDGDISYDSATGVISYTGPTVSDVRIKISAVDNGGDGSFTYDQETGVFTYTGPSDSEARAHFTATTSGSGFGDLTYDNTTGAFTYAKVTSANVRGELSATTASGVTYDSATGVIALSAIPNSSLSNSKVTVNGYDISLGGNKTLNADDIAEAVGGTNKYFTEARFDTSLAGKTTDDVAEGDNLYYTQARFDTAFTGKSTTDLSEGTNLYHTTTRARNSVSGGTGVTYDNATGVIAIGQAVGTTSDVTFGDVTVSGDLTVLGTLTAIQSNTVEISDINLTLAKGAANAAAANGAGLTIDGAGAEFFYSSADDRWNVNKSVNVTGGVTVTTTVTATTGFVGNLTGNVTGNLTGEVTGNASTATALKTARNIQGVSFDGTGAITVVTAGTGVTVTGTEVKIGQAVATTDSVTFAGVTAATFTGDLTGDVLGNVTGQVSDISNHTTDTLTEGTTNLYATAARVRAAVSATDAGGDGSFSYNQATGAFTYTGPSATEVRAHVSATNSGTGHGTLSYADGVFTFAKVTSADVRGEVSAIKVAGDGNFSYDEPTGAFSYTGPDQDDYRLAISTTKVSGDGSISYDNATGVISYTGPSATEVRAHISATSASGVTYTNGVIALASIPNSSLTNSKVTVNGLDVSLGGSTTLDTDDIAEGDINQYFLDSRARNAVSLTSDNQSVLSYNAATGAFTFSLSSSDTDDIAEGATNQYFTTARARASVSAGSNIAYDSATGVISTQAAVFSVNTKVGAVTLTTDDVNEGSTNKYFSDAQARSAVSLVTDAAGILSYVSGTGVFTFVTPDTDAIEEGATNKYYTDTRADDRIAAASVFDLADVDSGTLDDGYTLVWSAGAQKFIPQNITTNVVTMNFTGDGTTTSFNTGEDVGTINNTQVFVNGLVQAPTYSYTVNTVNGETSIVFDAAPETNDYIMVRLTPTVTLSAGGILNESSSIDGGTY